MIKHFETHTQIERWPRHLGVQVVSTRYILYNVYYTYYLLGTYYRYYKYYLLSNDK